ncbi:low-density lipoprotein receptor-related protein 2-like [Trichogramma pretiosum]|uniref:low-density lipoprotein receptor-related protein 2-like n=1 Tax=Trichogramma pretiosum TaxID=7493 RepID=UPI0006C9CBF6|nr:low-density lipoprotein receptor-related protein 2-like [Trichogramma pretiosum]
MSAPSAPQLEQIQIFNENFDAESVSSFVEKRHEEDYRYKRFGFRTKFQTQRVLREKCCNCYVAITIIVFLILLVILVALFGNKHSCGIYLSTHKKFENYDNFSVNISPVIYLQKKSDLVSFELYHQSFSYISTNSTEKEVIFAANIAFWVDQKTRTIQSFSRNYPKIDYPNLWEPVAIDVDYVSKKVYVINAANMSINVIDMYSKIFRAIITGLDNPCDLALDANKGLIFIVEKSKLIIRANMDGSSSKPIVQIDSVSSIAIDRDNEIIYWSNDFSSIASSDYNGQSVMILEKISMSIRSSVIYENKIFWTTNNSLWYCKISNRTCDSNNVHSTPLAGANLLKVVPRYSMMKNPCEEREEPCEKLCLLRASEQNSKVPDSSCWNQNSDSSQCKGCSDGYPTQIASTKNSTGADNQDLSNSLILSGGSSILILKYGNGSIVTLKHGMMNENFHIFDVYLNETVFWVDESTSSIKSLSNDFLPINYPKRWKPKVLKIDIGSTNFYLIDSVASTVNIIERQGTHSGIVISDLAKPCDLALDPVKRYMFIAQYHDSILKSSMSGENMTVLVRSVDISTIAIDYKTQTLYWGADYASINSIQFDGNNRKIYSNAWSKISSLAVSGNKIFWSDNLALWYCEISSNCKIKNFAGNAGNTKITNVFSYGDYQRNVIAVCKIKNGDCQQICIPSARMKSPVGRAGGYYPSCACSTGWELQADERNCSPIMDFMLYTQKNLIKGRILNSTKASFTEAILPTVFHTESQIYKGMIDFDFDIRSGNFYFNDDFNIYVINVFDDKEQITLVHVNESYQLKDVTYDWITGDIYYVQKSNDVENSHVLMVLKTLNNVQYRRSVNFFTHDLNFPMKGSPHALVIHPKFGYIYYTAWNATRKDIQRTSTFGKGLKEIASIDYHNMYRTIGIDYEKDKIYYLFSSWKVSPIHYTDLDGVETKKFNVTDIPYPITIFIYKDWLYVSNSTSIWRFNKYDGGQAEKMIPRFPSMEIISGVRIVSPSLQLMYDNNPCTINNGGCQQFCFAIPQKICACKDDQSIRNDNYCA